MGPMSAESGHAAPPAPSSGQGLSTGAKVFLGCLALFVVGSLAATFVLGAGVLFVGKAAKSVVADVRGEGGSGDILRTLEERHAFEPPDDGVVGSERARRFASAVHASWVRIQPRAESLNESSRAVSPESMTDAIAAMRGGMAGIEGLREGLAEGLNEAGMSLKEFLWVSTQLGAGYRAIDMASPPESVPQANIETAREHVPVLASLFGGRDATENRSAVLTVAVGAASIFAFEEIFTK